MKKNKLKVVAVGGGNGSAIVLEALKNYADRLEISAVISVSDSGGSSGELRRQFKLPPPGDILRAVLGLSPYDYRLLKKIFYGNRFEHLKKFKVKGAVRGLKGHNLGNLFLMMLANAEGDYLNAIRALEKAVAAQGHVYPVSLELTDLGVELANGRAVIGEGNIDRPNYSRKLKIEKAFLKPLVKVYKQAEQVLKSADVIIFCPGSLYCSVIAALLPRGVKEAIARNGRAKLVYIPGDAYEINGETGPEKLSEFVSQIEQYLPRALDVVMYNDCELSGRLKKRYKEKKWAQFKKDPEDIKGKKLVSGDFEKEAGGLSSAKLAPMLKKIIFV
ncbi:MAG: uridine diphosphate-N-acetylglucosamine-binding protein YvcK [Candidatus Magasanikbacteria bacterium]|nr:uridine diphosphate-N-acetylglucosamine-binding protein YvcK [Candidatus Magasanikbacteria bacterium]